MKKQLLLVALFCMPHVQSNSADALGGAFVGSLATGTVITSYMYLQYRESNAHVVDKVNRFWRHVSENVAKVREDEFARLIPVFKEFDIFIFDLKDLVKDRYDSWLTPWNWTPGMRQSFFQISMLQLMFKYLEIVSSWYVGIPDNVMNQLAEKVVHGPGVMTNFIDELNKDIKAIEQLSSVLQCNFSTALRNHLAYIRDIVKSSNAYTQERVSFV